MTDQTEKSKPEGILHDPYEWGQCAITAQIVWLPDGSVMLGVRSHLDAPSLTLLTGDMLTRLPGHAAELPIPSVETLADLLAQLREDLPLRAKAHIEREEAARKKDEESKVRTSKKGAKGKPTAVTAPTPAPARTTTAGKAPAPTQAALFNFMTGGN